MEFVGNVEYSKNYLSGKIKDFCSSFILVYCAVFNWRLLFWSKDHLVDRHLASTMFCRRSYDHIIRSSQFLFKLCRPNVSRPNFSGPNFSRPNFSRPNFSWPNVSQPNVIQTNVSWPNVSWPNVSRPNVSRPNVSRPNVSRPNVNNNIKNTLILVKT